MNVPLLVGLAAVGTGVTYLGSQRLERAANRLSAYLGLPAVVQGAVVVAVGSSFPELSSTVLATLLHGEFELGVGAVVGSAVFNLLVIPAASALLSEGTLDTDRDLVYKEAQFYMLSVAVLLLVFALAVIYQPVDGRLRGAVTRPLAVAPLALYGLYLFIQYLDTADAAVERDESVDPLRETAMLAVALALILVGVEALVQAAIGLGDAFGTPSFLWGLTVVAAGTSLPDAFVSISSARSGDSAVSLANVLGSNVFDLLVAVPAGVLLAGATVVSFEVIVPMMAFLIVATVVFFAMVRTDLELSGRESYVLLGLYVVFVAWLVAESLGATTLVGA